MRIFWAICEAVHVCEFAYLATKTLACWLWGC